MYRIWLPEHEFKGLLNFVGERIYLSIVQRTTCWDNTKSWARLSFLCWWYSALHIVQRLWCRCFKAARRELCLWYMSLDGRKRAETQSRQDRNYAYLLEVPHSSTFQLHRQCQESGSSTWWQHVIRRARLRHLQIIVYRGGCYPPRPKIRKYLTRESVKLLLHCEVRWCKSTQIALNLRKNKDNDSR